MLKRYISFIATVLIVFSFTGCNSAKIPPDDGTSGGTTEEASVSDTAESLPPDPVTTEAPSAVTTAAATDSEEPQEDAPSIPAAPSALDLQHAKLAELTYVDENGFTRIKGADSICLPTAGNIITFESKNSAGSFFASDSLQITDRIASIPSYSAGGTNCTGRVIEDRGRVFFSLDNDKTLILIPEEYTAEQNGTSVNVDAWYINGNTACAAITHRTAQTDEEFTYVITTVDRGKSFNDFKLNTDLSKDLQNSCAAISFYTESCGYISVLKECSGGINNYILYKTADGGKTFTNITDIPASAGRPIVFISENVGFAASSAYTSLVCKTEDGGKTWNTEKNNTGVSIEATEGFDWLGFTTPLTPYFEGDIGAWAFKLGKNGWDSPYTDGVANGYVYFITADGGDTWTLYTPHNTDKLPKVSVPYVKHTDK